MSEQVRRPVERDPLVAALARYVEALHRRYPEGPEQTAPRTLGCGAEQSECGRHGRDARGRGGMKEPRTLKRLPRSLDDIRGLRVARWIRESTAGQYDRYGPASQREQQDRFIERHGLVDTGLVYQVAHSGTTVWRSATMTEMLAEARAGAFDLLLAGYSDRWQRNLRRTLELLEDGLHPAGVALVMCDRRILSSDPQDWDELISRGGRRGEVQPPPVRADHRRLRREVRPPRRPGRPRGPRLPAPARAAAHPRGRPGHDRRSPSACSSGTPSAT